MKSPKIESILVTACLLAALVLWYIIFGLEAGNFWFKISFSSVLLASVSLWIVGRQASALFKYRKRHLLIGFGSALLLYGIFWAGKLVLTTLFPAARTAIGSVYTAGKETPAWLIALLLLAVTSPAEEIFWRGFIQRVFMQRMSPILGFSITLLCYTLVHIWSLNILLILAAFTAGFCWGLIYLLEKSLTPVIISHALWSVSAFVVFPFA